MVSGVLRGGFCHHPAGGGVSYAPLQQSTVLISSPALSPLFPPSFSSLPRPTITVPISPRKFSSLPFSLPFLHPRHPHTSIFPSFPCLQLLHLSPVDHVSSITSSSSSFPSPRPIPSSLQRHSLPLHVFPPPPIMTSGSVLPRALMIAVLRLLICNGGNSVSYQA